MLSVTFIARGLRFLLGLGACACMLMGAAPTFTLDRPEIVIDRAMFEPVTAAVITSEVADGMRHALGRESFRCHTASRPAKKAMDKGYLVGIRRGGYFDLWSAFDQTSARNAAAELTFIIDAPKPAEGYLAIGCDDGYRLTLNGQLISVRCGRRDLNANEDMIGLPLKSGPNQVSVVFVKEDQWQEVPSDHFGSEWGAVLRVYPDRESAVRGFRKETHHFLESPIVNDVAGLASTVSRGLSAKLSILALNLKPVWEAQLDEQGNLHPSPASGRFPHGDFVGFAALDGVMIEPVVIVPSFAALDESLPDRLGLPTHSEAWSFRAHHLLKPEFISLRDRWWARKLARALVMTALADEAGHQLDARYANWPAAHEPLGAYTSKIDGTRQFYRYARSTVGGTPRKLAIFFPGAPMPVRPFLESAAIADIKEAETLAAVANRQGVDVLWPGNVDVDYGGPITTAWAAEALQACLATHYSGEDVQVVPVGTCAAGVAALRFATSEPRVGGVVLWSPVPYRGTYRWPADEPKTVAPMPEAVWAWSQFPDLDRLKRIPVYLRYDIDVAGHGDRTESRDFARRLRSTGGDIVERWVSDPDQLTEWGLRGIEAEGEWLRWIRTQPSAPVLAPSGTMHTRSIQARLLRGFQLKSDGSSVATAWLKAWQERMAEYRGSTASKESFSPDVTVLVHTSAQTDLIDLLQKVDGQSLSSDDAAMLVSSAADGWMLAASTDQGVNVWLSGAVPADQVPPIDLLTEGQARSVLWLKSGPRWVVAQAIP